MMALNMTKVFTAAQPAISDLKMWRSGRWIEQWCWSDQCRTKVLSSKVCTSAFIYLISVLVIFLPDDRSSISALEAVLLPSLSLNQRFENSLHVIIISESSFWYSPFLKALHMCRRLRLHALFFLCCLGRRQRVGVIRSIRPWKRWRRSHGSWTLFLEMTDVMTS